MKRTDKTSLKADREDWGVSGTIGDGGSGSQNPCKNLTKAYQEPPGASRTHVGSTRNALGPLGTTFSTHLNIFQIIVPEKQPTNPRARPSPRRGPLSSLRIPSLRITHAGAVEISRSDSPPTSDHITPHHIPTIMVLLYPIPTPHEV